MEPQATCKQRGLAGFQSKYLQKQVVAQVWPMSLVCQPLVHTLTVADCPEVTLSEHLAEEQSSTNIHGKYILVREEEDRAALERASWGHEDARTRPEGSPASAQPSLREGGHTQNTPRS